MAVRCRFLTSDFSSAYYDHSDYQAKIGGSSQNHRNQASSEITIFCFHVMHSCVMVSEFKTSSGKMSRFSGPQSCTSYRMFLLAAGLLKY
jgi:hypothetical protein